MRCPNRLALPWRTSLTLASGMLAAGCALVGDYDFSGYSLGDGGLACSGDDCVDAATRDASALTDAAPMGDASTSAGAGGGVDSGSASGGSSPSTGGNPGNGGTSTGGGSSASGGASASGGSAAGGSDGSDGNIRQCRPRKISDCRGPIETCEETPGCAAIVICVDQEGCSFPHTCSPCDSIRFSESQAAKTAAGDLVACFGGCD